MTPAQLALLGINIPAPSAEARGYNFNERDFMLLMLMAVGALNANTAAVGGAKVATPAVVNALTTAGGQTLLAASTTGRKCTIFNHGSFPVTISDGGTPAAGVGTATIQPGGYWERPEYAKSEIKGLGIGGASTCTITRYD